MPADTYTLTMKKLDRAKWQRVKAKAALMGLTVRGLIDRLMDECLDPPQQRYDYIAAMEWGFKAGEKGWNLDKSIQEFKKGTYV